MFDSFFARQNVLRIMVRMDFLSTAESISGLTQLSVRTYSQTNLDTCTHAVRTVLGGTMPDILHFTKENRWLSNFYPARVKYDGVEYPTTEHAYQAAKTLDTAAREKIRQAAKPAEARKLGQLVTFRPGWDDMKIAVMEELCRQKFSAEPLRSMLLATGDGHLEEGNWWKDVFWGTCNGVGRNELGKLLMRIRESLRPSSSESERRCELT
jgi:N-glycosidase YbiA